MITSKIQATRRRIRNLFLWTARYSYARVRTLFHGQQNAQHTLVLLTWATPASLINGCVSDLRTALYRMGERIDALPGSWCSPFGSTRLDPIGNLQPSTQTLACMQDMQNSASRFPTATAFDWEIFRLGWEAGAKWNESNLYKTEQAGNAWNPPNVKSIEDFGDVGGVK